MNTPVRFGLRARLLTLTVGLSVVTSAGVWFVTTQMTRSALLDASMNELAIGSKNLARTISDNLQDTYADAVTSARLDIVAQAIDSGDPKNFRWYASELVRTKPRYVAIVAADLDHRIIDARIPKGRKALATGAVLKAPWAEAALDAKVGEGVFVPPSRPDWLAPSLAEGERVVGFSLPVVDVLDEPVGTLTILSSLDHVGGVLDGFSRSKGAALAAVAVLATAEGELLAAPDGARAWGRVDGYSASTTWNAPDGNAFATKATPLEGVMGVDGWRVVAMQSEATLDAPVAAMGFRLLAAFGLGLLLTALGMVLVSQRIVDPIRRLMAATQKGDRVSDIPTIAVSSRDEVGVLTESFNRMIEAVRDYEVGLERKVEERTEALTRAQREMQDILDNVSQGMFTVGRDGSVNGGYSAFTVEVLGTEDVRGRQALDLLQVSESRDVMTTSRMKFWLENVFGADELQWMLAEDEPVKSWELEGQDGTAKTLALEYAPIYEDDEVDKIMVVAKDVTAIKALEAEVAQQASSLSRMSEIATLDPELLDTFLTETKEILALSGEAVERIEVDPGDKSAIHALFRQVHTIKGNARVFDIRSVQDHAHRVESDLAPLREGTEPLTPEQVADVKSRIVSIGALVQEIEALARPILDRRSPAAHKRLDEATVEKVTKTFAALRRDLDDGVSLDDSLRELGAAVRGLSMQRLDETFERLEKMVVDLARELDKPLAGLHLDCGDLRVERSAADALRDALLHILRNAVDHGIESADERRAAGKPEQAKLELVARMVDDELVVEVRDDGRGIDKERVRAAAKRRDVADTGALESMVTQDLLQLVFEAGFSTRDEVSDVSGRGVGMDVVAQAVRELSGRTELSSSLGAGTQLSIVVPRGAVGL